MTQPLPGPAVCDFQPRTRTVFGPGVVDRLGTLARPLGKRVLLVTDPGIVAAGHLEPALLSLQSAGLDVAVFDDVEANPTTAHVRHGVQAARDHGADLLVGLGGGSAMDAAKGINFVLCGGGEMKDYWGVGKATADMLPMVAVPTTAGTGSEAQSFALISDEHTHAKMACGDPKAACAVALLDPRLTVSQPAAVSATVGIDAIAHALESYVCTRRNPFSAMFAARAWKLLAGSFERVLDDPHDLEARGDMQLGAHFAGAAIENSMLGATHSLANPLTARHGTTHGVAIGVLLPHVIGFNARAVDGLYHELAAGGGAELADTVRRFVRRAGLPTTLAAAGVPDPDVAALADEAAAQWTAQFNPRAVDADALAGLYRAAAGTPVAAGQAVQPAVG